MGKFKNFLLGNMAESPKTAEQQRHEDFVLGKTTSLLRMNHQP